MGKNTTDTVAAMPAQHVYGPVPSQRLGLSLGVDLIPFKTCTLDCIYCQLGKTRRKTLQRKEYVPAAQVVQEIRQTLQEIHDIDYITFAGSGEPTLHSGIGDVIRGIKKITDIPVAVLTNGTLLFEKPVAESLLSADVVVPSLDAASPDMFRRINRPHRSLNIDTIINGMKRFRQRYRGQIWVEIMLIRGFNDNREEIARIREAISGINPEKIQLKTVTRPPSESFAVPLNPGEIDAVKRLLPENAEVADESPIGNMQKEIDVEAYTIRMAKRRPIGVDDVAHVFGISESNAERMLDILEKKGLIKKKTYLKKTYYIC